MNAFRAWRRPAAISAAIALGLAGLASAAHAQSIGINFTNGVGNGGGDAVGTPLQPFMAAGVVPQENWNNLAPNAQAGTSGTFTDPLVDNKGVAVPKLTASWSSHAKGACTFDGFGSKFDKPGDVCLFSNSLAVVNAVPGEDTPWGSTFTLSGIPYATYDVYVYSEGAAGQAALVNLNGAFPESGDPKGGTTVSFTHLGGDMDKFVQATGKASDGANYVLFKGVTGATLTINARENNGGLVGLQIVATPAASAAPSVPAASPAPAAK